MSYRVRHRIRQARIRLQAERLLKGVAVIAGALFAGLLLSTYLLAQNNFSDTALFWTRLIGAVGLLALGICFFARPLLRPPSRPRVARFLEERHPELEERLSTAVELEDERARIDPEIRRLVTEDAQHRLSRIASPPLYHLQRSLLSALVVFSCLVAFALLFVGGAEVFPYSLNKLLRGWMDDNQPPLYHIQVTPGDTTVGKRSDLEVRAMLQGFDSDRVELVARYENEPQWEEALMQLDLNGAGFVFVFFDIRDRIEYFVRADGIQSDTFTIEVSEIPRVEKLTIVLDFPRYAGLSPVRLEEEGDIRALAGTTARVTIETDQPVRAGKVRMESGEEIPLESTGPRQLQGSFKITKQDYYRFHLQDREGFWNPASGEYLIEALEDQPPIVRFTRPGRDRKVTNIEEVFTEIQAEDDYGVSNLALRFSVNGDSEQEAELDYRRGSTSPSTSYTFYLEEFSLQPGDFISYYAEARDANTVSSTDIYFFEVEPFDREYYQSQQSGQPGQGQQQTMLSRRQKDIIAATFKLQRDRRRYSGTEFEENSQTLALVQQRLQGEAQTIVERIQRRGAAMLDRRFQEMVEHLTEAIGHMEPAQKHLNEQQISEALPEEQKSLQQLLRAEALFKDIQVSLSQNQGGGGPSQEQIQDLIDLELDRTKNQYETLEQNRQENREQQLDEALEKLKELARRQQQMTERRRQQQQAQGSGSSSQQNLIEETEELLRQLERLSRREPDRNLQQVSRELRQALRDMRRAQSEQDSQEAQMRAQQALDRLQQAQQQLSQQRRSQQQEGMQRLQEAARELVQGQEEVLEGIDDLKSALRSGRVDRGYMDQLRQLLRRKSELLEDLQRMEGDLHQTARQMTSRQPEASEKLKEAALEIRDQRLPEKMQDGSELLSRGLNDLAEERERGLLGSLRDLEEKIGQAQEALSANAQNAPQENLEGALDRLGSLVENLESLRDRADQQQQGQEQQGQQGERPGRPGEGQQGQEEQQGRQPGEREEQGSSGQQPGSSRQQRPSGQENPRAGEEGRGHAGDPRWGMNRSGINPRQLGREWSERVREAHELEQMLEGSPELARDVEALIRQMRRIDTERLFTDKAEIARLKSQIIDGFRQLELEINRAMQEDLENLLRMVNQDEIPPEFRARVEEYYRALSRGGGRKP